MTRFPPEPNGYLHIGHAKSICLNFGIAEQVPGAVCNLRFDDTNPTTEEDEFVRAIQEDVRWLGFDWGDRLYFASDYFEKLYAIAVKLIEAGKAYVDSQSLEEMRAGRGSFYKPGRVSPYRDRTVAENLDLFKRMRAGEFPDGAHVLRAKIDMQSPNQNLRDPVMYRIQREHHHRTGDAWCIYPMYDFAHGYSDAIEGVTHSICTLEFENHRPLYDWFLDQAAFDPRPQQIEFAQLNLTYTITSKRKLKQLVEGKHVSGLGRSADADARGAAAARLHAGGDPRVLRAHRRLEAQQLRRRGAPRARGPRGPERAVPARDGRRAPAARRARELPGGAGRRLRGALVRGRPGEGRPLAALRRACSTSIATTSPRRRPKGWFRLSPGGEVRLRYACIIKCERVVKDEQGEVAELRCTWDPGLARRQPEGRAQDQGHPALGLRGARRAGRGAPLRPPLQGRAARRGSGRSCRRGRGWTEQR